MSIRFKVILPYLLLTLIVAATGAYIVIRLVSNTLAERLTNQLIEAGRVVSDTLGRREGSHIESARFIAFTRGLGEALDAGDDARVVELAKPAMGADVETVLIFNAHGQESAHFIRQSDGEISTVTQPGRASTLSIVDELLKENNVDSLPRRVITIDPVDKRYYYFTTLPVVYEDQVVGAVVVGTSLNVLMPLFKSTSLADVVLYDGSGHSIASTFASQDDLYQQTISIPLDRYQTYLNNDNVVMGRNVALLDGRSYNLAYGPLKIANDRLGVFAVALSSDFVVESGSTNRRNYVWVYALAMIGVIMIGYFVSRLIITPLYKLVRTSRAIAGGDLSQRTEIKSRDEIGVLANTFNEMTDHLQQRTLELEKANKVLEQMDRAKMRFIQIAAHELRTPLTLVQGYTQMVQFKAKENNEYAKYTEGILEGTTRMVEVIDNMLDVSRIDSNLLEILPAEIQLGQIIDRVNKSFASALQERNLVFETQGLDSLPVIIGDKDLLYKLFYHVIVNAIKYTPDGGCITVSGRTVRENESLPQVEIAVKDTGIGIDPQNHDLVFEKFYQTGEVLLHSSGKTKFRGGGPGLGLAISRGIVNAHHGSIWLESPGFDELKNPGTTVFVRLPINGRFDERS